MKVGNRASSKVSTRSVRPNKNNSKKNLLVLGVLVVTLFLIIWVYTMGRKAEETISVVMYSEPIYKNEVITESMLKEYKMLKGEFEKYAVEQTNGSMKRRILTWDERGKLINAFAAYPLQQDTVAMYTDVIKSRIDNSDTVLYSFPGKNIVRFETGSNELNAFKTFLQPGDRINVIAIYKVEEEVYMENEYGELVRNKVETIKQEVAFRDIVLADLLNQQGDSILDIYASYNDKTVYQQAAMDASESFQKSVQPANLLVALTPEEQKAYYSYLSKNEITFKISLPQRVE